MQASIEILSSSATQAASLPGLQSVAPVVFLPMIQGHVLGQQVDAIATLTKAGFSVVPHMAARRFTEERHVAALLREYQASGVSEVLLLGGDDRVPGVFDSSLALLETGLLEAHGITKVYFAGHPEGNPVDANDLVHMTQKVDAAREREFAVEVLTQMCFDPFTIQRYLQFLGDMNVPVRVGIPGPVKLSALTKFALQCGLGNVTSVLQKQGFSLTRLFTAYNPAKIVDELPKNVALHVYTFGALEKTQEWLTAR